MVRSIASQPIRQVDKVLAHIATRAQAIAA